MKEASKLHRERKSQVSYTVSKRLHSDVSGPEEMNIDAGAGSKRRNMGSNKKQEEEKKDSGNIFKGLSI